MKISSIVDIVQGELKTNPTISFITQSHTNINKVNDGDLFISSNKEEINLALKQGAFAIIYDIDIQISDTEVAWIKVENIEDTCLKLIRYHLSELKINSIITDEISFNIFKIFNPKNKTCVYIDENIINNFEIIKNNHITENIISNNKRISNIIYPNSKNFEITKYTIDNLIVHSLFETSFSYKHRYFHKLKLPMIYIDNFINVIEFIKIIDIDTNKLNSFSYMCPVFISKSLQIVDYGKSNTFILANNSTSTNYLEIAFIKKFYTYGQIKVIETSNDNEILDIFKKNIFNAIYIKTKTTDEIKKLLQSNQVKSLELF